MDSLSLLSIPPRSRNVPVCVTPSDIRRRSLGRTKTNTGCWRCLRCYIAFAMEDERNSREIALGVAEQIVDHMFRAFPPAHWPALLHVPLASAAWEGDEGMVQKLVEAGARIGDALHAAVRGGHGKIVNHLLESGASIHEPDGQGLPPLHVAAVFGQAEILRSLLLKGADKDSLDVSGCTALYRAFYANDDSMRSPPLSGEHCADVVRALLDHGANVRITDRRGRTPLHCAETKEVIDMLVEAGSDVHARTDDGSTSLHFSASGSNGEAVLALLKHGADVNAKDDTESTPLHAAVWYAHLQESAPVVELLLRSGADEKIVNDHGLTAEEYHRTYYEHSHPNDDVEAEHVWKLLRDAPADRAWRRRGFLVMCRAHPDRLSGFKESINIATDGGRPTRSRSQAQLATAGVGTRRGRVRRENAADEEPGCSWRAVAARLLGFEEEGIFRTIVSYL